MQTRFFGVPQFEYLSAFTKECAYVEVDTLLTQLRVAFFFVGYATFCAFGALTYSDHTLYNGLRCIGMPLTYAATLGWASMWTQQERLGLTCNKDPLESPNWPIAVVAFVTVYNVVFRMWVNVMGGECSMFEFLLRYTLFLLVAVDAQVSLYVATWNEAVEGLLIGAMVGMVLVTVLIIKLVPDFRKDYMQTAMFYTFTNPMRVS